MTVRDGAYGAALQTRDRARLAITKAIRVLDRLTGLGRDPGAKARPGLMICGLKGLLSSVVLAVTLSASSAVAVDAAGPQLDCSDYRQGPLVTRRIAIYGDGPIDPFKPIGWKTVRFEPLFVLDPGIADLPNPDGSPKRTLLFDLGTFGGRPPPLEIRRHTNPRVSDFVTVFIDGLSGQWPLSRIVYTSFFFRMMRDGDPFEVKVTGERMAGVQAVEAPPNPAEKDKDWFADLDASGQPIAVMECSAIGAFPVPHCTIYEKIDDFEVSTNFRRDRFNDLPRIRAGVRRFVQCLTSED